MKSCLAIFVFVFSVIVFAADTSSDLQSIAIIRTIRGGNGVTLPPPPPTEAKPVTDNVNGTSMADPYRWLEDGQSPETRAWIDSQMKYTQEYLSQVKIRPEIAKSLTELIRVESYSIPVERQDNYFFTKRLPDENQASIYMRKGLHGTDERLVDANKMSADQNTSVHIDDVSKTGDLLVYGVREGGADEQSVHFLDVAKHQELTDVLPKARYSGISLTADKQGLYYGKFDSGGHAGLLPQAGDVRGVGCASVRQRIQRREVWANGVDRRRNHGK